MVQSSIPTPPYSYEKSANQSRKRASGTYNLRKRLDGGEILEVIRIGDLTRSPDALVCGVVNLRCGPLALVSGVGLVGALPFTTARSLSALGVGDSRSDPVTIFFIVPLLGLGGIYDNMT